MASHGTTPPLGQTSSGNATQAAAQAAQAALNIRRAKALFYNQRASQFYGVAIGAIIVVFTFAHWSRYLYSRYTTRDTKKSALMRFQVSFTRILRHMLVRPVLGFTSLGHALLVLAYLGANAALTVTNVEISPANLLPVAKRLGWIAILNTAFITFLALKNTPLAFLTAYSYERLNVLHQIGGYTTIISTFLHATLMSVAWYRRKNLHELIDHPQIPGIMAAVAALIIITSVFTVKKIRYELFYITHILMYMVFIIGIALHQIHIEHKVIIITIFAGTMWISDRLLRGFRIIWYSHKNRATVTPLPNGGTRIVLSRSPSRAEASAHCFLWIPKIRAFETHPFTIVSATPTSLEFVVAAYDGFTSDLHQYAIDNPGTTLRASVDGPYGVVPNLARSADTVVLIAGGSGASFTFGAALDIIKKRGSAAKPSIEFCRMTGDWKSHDRSPDLMSMR